MDLTPIADCALNVQGSKSHEAVKSHERLLHGIMPLVRIVVTPDLRPFWLRRNCGTVLYVPNPPNLKRFIRSQDSLEQCTSSLQQPTHQNRFACTNKPPCGTNLKERRYTKNPSIIAQVLNIHLALIGLGKDRKFTECTF